MVAWIYDGSDWGALIQHGIGTIVSSELAHPCYIEILMMVLLKTLA